MLVHKLYLLTSIHFLPFCMDSTSGSGGDNFLSTDSLEKGKAVCAFLFALFVSHGSGFPGVCNGIMINITVHLISSASLSSATGRSSLL